MPKVSVIVPNYNHARFLETRMESIFGQTYEDYEVILLDDLSTDSSIEVLRKYADRANVSHFVVNQQNSGSTFSQWKKGISLASGKYIWIAESDDFAAPSFLSSLVPLLESRPETGLAFCQSEIVNEHGDFLYNNIRWTDPLDPYFFKEDFCASGKEIVRRFFSFRNIIPNASACLFRRELFLSVGGNVAEFRYCGDWILWINFLLQSDVAFVARPLNHFRQHGGVTRFRRTLEKKRQYFEEVLRIRRVVFEVVSPTFDESEKIHEFAAAKLLRGFGIKQLIFTKSGRDLLKRYSALDAKVFRRVIFNYLRKKTQQREHDDE